MTKLASRVVTGAGVGPRLLVTAGVHGDEYEPMAACRRLAAELPALLLRGRVTLIPCVNEPAFERGTRTGPDGLDLARICPGRPDGGATEQIAHALAEEIRAADYYIDLHTGGVQYRLSPLAGYTLHRNPKVLDAQRRMARAFNLPIVWGTSSELDGRSLSVARDAGVPAIYAEYEGGAECNPTGVAAYVDGVLNVLEMLDLIAPRSVPSQVRHVVEDDRPNAGFLQLYHPSPLAGIFEPCVTLDQRVAAGEPLGTVSDLLGEQQATVRAECTGIVLMLRALPRVAVGDALGMVLTPSD